MDTDQKPYGRSTSDNLSNGLMYSLTYSFNSSGTGVFVFAVVGQLFRPRARFAAHPAARHVTRATPARYELTLTLHGLSKESSGFTLSVYFIYNFLLRPLTKN